MDNRFFKEMKEARQNEALPNILNEILYGGNDTLVQAIQWAKEMQKKLKKLYEKNSSQYETALYDAKKGGFFFNEFDQIILCRIDLDPRSEKRDWQDYFLIEESVTPQKALMLSQQGRFQLDINYHKRLKRWEDDINLLLLSEQLKNTKTSDYRSEGGNTYSIVKWANSVYLPLESPKRKLIFKKST